MIFKERITFSKGDLVETVSSGCTNARLAIIQRATPSDFGGRIAVVGVSKEDGQRWLSLHSIRFHFKNFCNIEGEGDVLGLWKTLEDFEVQVKLSESSIYHKVSSLALEKSKNGLWLDQLIYHEELIDRVFDGDHSLSSVQAYCLHKAIISAKLIRDSPSRVSTAYRPFPESISRTLNRLRWLKDRASPEYTSFKQNLAKFVFSTEEKPVSVQDIHMKMFLELSEFYATHGESTSGMEDVEKLLREILSGVLPISRPSDFVLLLERFGKFPGKWGMPLRQSLLIDHVINESESTIASNKVNYPQQSPLVHSHEIIAVDSESTIEVDDAVSMTVDQSGDQWVHIHIADPSALISPESSLDRHARSKVSTLYLPEVTSPMLPGFITKISSLSEEHRYNNTLTFSVKLGSDGDILDYSVNTCTTFKIKRLTYEECDRALSDSQDRLHDHLCKLYEMARRHRNFRVQNGLKDLDFPKSSIKLTRLDKSSKFRVHVVAESSSPRSTLLVSECMIMAGRVAARYSIDHRLPVPFRYHDNPNIPDTLTAAIPDKLRVLDAIKASAIDICPREHWGMALKDGYVKATSPLRRYLDLVVHMQIRSALRKQSPAFSEASLVDLIPRVYANEQYVKRLQKASSQFWMLKYLQQECEEKGLAALDCVPVSAENGLWLYVSAPVNMILPARLAASVLSNVRLFAWHRCRLLNADPYRNYIEVEFIQ